MAKYSTHQIQEIERKEHIGTYGAWRKVYCEKYREALDQVRKDTYNDFLNILDSRGEKITCREGCVHCCYQHIYISLAHGIVIVDYLYSKQAVLKQFLSNYEKWRHSIGNISDRIDNLRGRVLSEPQSLGEVIASTEPLSKRYFTMQVPCPFLIRSACAIYIVRPICCSSHYSVSPPEWCEFTNPNELTIHEVIPKYTDIYKLVELGGPKLTLYQLTLPTLIYRLLTEGLSTILNKL